MSFLVFFGWVFLGWVFLGGFFIARTLPADRPARGSDSPTTAYDNTLPAPAPGCCPPDRSDKPATSRSSRETDRSADSSPERRGLRIRIHFIRIRIQLQHFRLNTPIRIQGFKMNKNVKKISAEKKIKLF